MIARPCALLSIHDVMPETLPRVAELLRRIDAAGLAPPALLVVPGRDWTREQLKRLAGWIDGGCEPVAHGWLHHTRPRRLLHRCHAALISRNVAEHLALDAPDIAQLMQRSHDWFAEAALPAPQTYIPPAWALGMHPRHLTDLPYRCVETLRGVHLRDVDDRWRFHRLPLVGFEADTAFRARVLRPFNRLQRRQARRRGLPLRIGIHPEDAQLLLSADLLALLSEAWNCRRYDDLRSADLLA